MITNISDSNENWIYQSNKLIEASYSMTVLEQKLVRLLASFVKKSDNEFKVYEFKATELCKILNIKRQHIYKELDNATDKLMGRYIKIKNDNEEKFKKRHLIKLADFENGVLSLKIDEEVKEFYLNLNWYTKYQLKNIMKFKSTYSFRLYELLKQYEKIGERIIKIDELRTMLEVPADKYTKYSNIKQKVIDVATKEINNKTDLFIKYESIKVGRKITAIKFYIKTNKLIDDPIKFEVAADEEPKDIDIVKEIIKEKITSLDAKKILKAANGDIKIIKDKYILAQEQKEIKNIVAWLISAIKTDYKPGQAKVSKGGFNNFEPRSLDERYVELRNKKLSGQATEEEEEEFKDLKIKLNYV